MTVSAQQLRKAEAVTRWYLDRYHGTADDIGVARMFTDASRVGHFAVSLDALRAGEPAALSRLLMATVMFQRRQDLQIMRVLQGISAHDAAELSSPAALLALADASQCERLRSNYALLAGCDLRKDGGIGVCDAAPEVACAPKRHAVLLKRYGHFGRVPTSLALTLRDNGVEDLAALRLRALRQASTPAEAAECLERMLSGAWRVSDKIAAMYLSMLSNPDLCPGTAPWSEGLDWTRWVVIDSNVDLFLAWLGYAGFGTYAARRAFLQALSAQLDLGAMKPGLHAYNPRIVQQAAYLFMSVTNRRALERDCSRVQGACLTCPEVLVDGCGLRRPRGGPTG
jgi:hypothetical protein